ncbi:MAG: hypothetical protein FWG90_12100 [Oscillospiraceae bacterium]|nr:hypothetical protein [Oscillospiraceae bacterium]
MEGTGFLRTVRVGGFDKKDVLTYVDELNTKIYTLEAELEEKKALLESASSSGGTVDTGKYEELLAADKVKITELQTDNSSLKNQMSICQEDIAEANKELESLRKQNAALENELQDAKNKIAAGGSTASDNAMDLSNVFMEAQKTANSIVTQAKENAKKMDEDAKKLANQVVDDANGKASSIVKTAESKADKIMTDAEGQTKEMKDAALNIKTLIATEIGDIETNVYKLNEILQLFSNESLAKISESKSIIEKTKDALSKGEIPVVVGSKPSMRPAGANPKAAPAPNAPKPPINPPPKAAGNVVPPPKKPDAPPPPAPPPMPRKKFGIDMSELENLTKAAEAAEQQN